MDVDELLENLRKDREKLSAIRDKVLSGALSPDTDTYGARMAAEKLAIVTDTLTKVSSQMFEIMKEADDRAKKTDDFYSSDIFDEIKNGEKSQLTEGQTQDVVKSN